MKTYITLHACIILGVISQPLQAMSEAGHAIIALMAYDLLEPAEQAKLFALMQQHPRFTEDFKPPAKMPNDQEQLRWQIGRIGYWPDIARKQPMYDRPTWHYELGPSLVIGDPSQLKVPERPAPLPANATMQTQSLYVSQAIELCKRAMGDRSLANAERAVAMCWIAHLVADSHQPCHAGSLYMVGVFEEPDGDRGANRILTKQKRNMHALWDQLLGDDFNLGDLRRKILEIKTDDAIRQQVNETGAVDGVAAPQQWLAESRELATSHVYTPEVINWLQRVSRGLVDKPGTLELSEQYLHSAGGVARFRAAQAATRLARTWKDLVK